jgi:hypothetical protein
MPSAQWAQKLLPKAENGIQTWLFPQRMTNATMVWAVCNGFIGILIFFILYFVRNKKHGATLQAVKIKITDLLKTLLLAVIVFASFFAVDYLCYYFFHVDFRFMFISARFTFNLKLLLIWLMYIPLFYVFYISNSIRVNCTMRNENWSERKSTIIACLSNSVGLILILVIQYLGYAFTGTVTYSSYDSEWLYCNILF